MSFCDECKREDEDFTTPEERAVLEAAEKWFMQRRWHTDIDVQASVDEEHLQEEPDSRISGLSVAIARMLKARGGA